MVTIILLLALLSFDCQAAEYEFQQTTIDSITEDIVPDDSVIDEPTTEDAIVDNDILINYDITQLTEFGYITELPVQATLNDFYIVLVKTYNLILIGLWIFVAFEVIELVARSIGRLKRKN